MKYSIILIATIFLIGIISDAGAQNGKDKEKNKNAAKDKGTDDKAVKDNKNDKSGKGAAKSETPPKKKESDKDSDDKETDEESEEDQKEEEEEEPAPPPKKKGAANAKSTKKKTPPKKGAGKTRASRKEESDEEEEEEEEEEEVRPKKKSTKKPTLTDLKDQAASVNPANLIAALQSTPVDKLQEVLPQLNKLTKSLDGTPLEPIFKNLTSLLGNSSPQIWQTVFQAFPNFLSTIIGTAGQLTAVAATAFGRTVKSIVDIADVLFNGGKDVLGAVTLLPGGQLLTPLGMILDTVHGTFVTPLDNIAGEVAAAGKREQKRMARAAGRTRSGLGSAGGLLGGLV